MNCRTWVYVGLIVLLVGVCFVGDAFFAPEIRGTNIGGFTLNNSSQVHTFFAFLKPTDRLICSYTSNLTGLAFIADVVSIPSGHVIANETFEGGLSWIFTPPSRGIYEISISTHSPSFDLNGTVNTVYSLNGGEPTDLIYPGVITLTVGLAVTVIGLAYQRMLPAKRDKPHRARSDGALRRSQFFTLTKWELGSRRIYLALIVFAVLLYTGGAFYPGLSLNFQSGTPVRLANLLVPSFAPAEDWFDVFPIVVAAMAFSFSYEKDSLVLRSMILNPIRTSRLFIAKLASAFILILVPAVISVIAILILFDPIYFLANPFQDLGNAWIWVLIYATEIFAMIGISALPSAYFRKPLYAFLIPLLGYYVLETHGFGLYEWLPSTVWQNEAFAIGEGNRMLGNFVQHSIPTLIFALAGIVLAFVIFQVRDRE